MTLGEKLYELRKKHGLSQEQLAEALNVSRQSISKWEGNVTYPESDKLIALSDYFGVSLDYLMKADWKSETTGDIQTQTPVSVETMDNLAENTLKNNQFKKQTHLLAGITICIAAVIGLIWFGLVDLFLPDSYEQIGASSIIQLNGTALLVLFFFGLLIIGISLIVRFLRRK